MKKIAVIFAGGVGLRMKIKIPKQFLKVHSKEIIVHTLEVFNNNENIDEMYVACLNDWIPCLKNLIKKYDINKVKRVFSGGETVQESIFKGLSEVKKDYEEAIVLIHDGVRPLVSNETINNCVEAVEKYGSAITVTSSFENQIKSLSGEYVDEILPLKETFTAQAPQCFYLNDILRAHLEERKEKQKYEGILDSCSLMLKRGTKCHLVVGNRNNIKLTTQDDYYNLIGNYSIDDYRELISVSKNKEKE